MVILGNVAVIWYIFIRFGALCQVKSGNPAFCCSWWRRLCSTLCFKIRARSRQTFGRPTSASTCGLSWRGISTTYPEIKFHTQARSWYSEWNFVPGLEIYTWSWNCFVHILWASYEIPYLGTELLVWVRSFQPRCKTVGNFCKHSRLTWPLICALQTKLFFGF
jgi:hypothetical protein